MINVNRTSFPDGTTIRHRELEETQLWDLTRKWREQDAKKPRKSAKIVDWAKNRFKTA